MTDKPKRPAMTKKRRLVIWERDAGVCYLCGLKVMAGEAWDMYTPRPNWYGGIWKHASQLARH